MLTDIILKSEVTSLRFSPGRLNSYSNTTHTSQDPCLCVVGNRYYATFSLYLSGSVTPSSFCDLYGGLTYSKMQRSIKELSVRYDPINETSTFTNGDIVEGRVVLEVTKEIKVEDLFVKLTGDADVRWTEGSGDDEKSYSDHERYFKLKQYFIQDSSKKGMLA